MFFAHLHLEGSAFMFQPEQLIAETFADRNIVVVQRLSSQQNLKAIALMKQHNLKVIYDLDDDIWSVPTYNPIFSKMKNWILGFEVCARMADLITVSTEHLRLMVKKGLGKNCPPVEVVENAVDHDWFRPIPSQYRKKRDGKIVVGWAGTNTHTGDIDRVLTLMPQILSENPNVDFEIVGHEIPPALQAFGERVRERYFVPIAEFASNWAGWQWDVSLAPVAENAFNLSKSNIKMLEAAAVSIPCVASDFGEYRKFATHSRLLKKSVLCDSSKDWKNRITALVRDEPFRKMVGAEMLSVSQKHYDIIDRTKKWDALFRQVLS